MAYPRMKDLEERVRLKLLERDLHPPPRLKERLKELKGESPPALGVLGYKAGETVEIRNSNAKTQGVKLLSYALVLTRGSNRVSTVL